MAYIGEIRMFSTDFPPPDWALCNGGLLQIAVYRDLFRLIGTTYGGDGKTTFALPNLQGKVPVHYAQGDTPFASEGGEESITLTLDQMPIHSHMMYATNKNGTAGNLPTGTMLAVSSSAIYSTETTKNTTEMSSSAITTSCGNGNSVEAHDNRQPFLTVNFCICLWSNYTPQRQ